MNTYKQTKYLLGEVTSAVIGTGIGHTGRLILIINGDSLMIRKTRRLVDGKDDVEVDDTYELKKK